LPELPGGVPGVEGVVPEVGGPLGDWVSPGVLDAVPEGAGEGALSGEEEHALTSSARAITPVAIDGPASLGVRAGVFW
jgi:hypothetical protein